MQFHVPHIIIALSFPPHPAMAGFGRALRERKCIPPILHPIDLPPGQPNGSRLSFMMGAFLRAVNWAIAWGPPRLLPSVLPIQPQPLLYVHDGVGGAAVL